jgi:ferredoxin-NADP reductase
MMAAPALHARISAIEVIAPTLKRFVLEPADGGAFPAAPAGAHIQLTLDGPSRRWKNAYSLVSIPERTDRYEIIVRRVADSRGGSAFLHEATAPGAIVPISMPVSLFPIVSPARKHLLISAGIGITPFLSFLPRLTAAGAALELHHFAKANEMPAFQSLLAPFAGAPIFLHRGRQVMEVATLLGRHPLGAHLYVCGPDDFMTGILQTASGLGWPAGKLHRESFGINGTGAAFTVRLARTERDIAVPGDQSLLEALEGAGIDAPYLCRGGACGQCAVPVLEGMPEHRDHVLTVQERAAGNLMMTCVSRAHTPALVIDL